MKLLPLVLATALFLFACSKISQENFDRIQNGMAEAEVLTLLGSPTESRSLNVLGVSGTVSRWVDKDAVITVRFVNGKMALKAFDKPAGKRK